MITRVGQVQDNLPLTLAQANMQPTGQQHMPVCQAHLGLALPAMCRGLTGARLTALLAGYMTGCHAQMSFKEAGFTSSSLIYLAAVSLSSS